MQGIQFEYFRGMEAEQYTFYRIPKILFTAKCFRSLSCEAKVLYGLLLDRMSLSIKNRWLDEEDRVYIVFTVEEIVGLMDCGTQKAIKLLKELDADKGIGLIEKKRLGLGKPNVIYVKNFIISQAGEDGAEEKQAETAVNMQNCENQNSGIVENTNQQGPPLKNHEDHNPGITGDTGREMRSAQVDKEDHNSGTMKTADQESPKPQFQNCENQNSAIVKITNQESSKSQFQNCENQNSGMMNITILELPKSQSNNTDISNIDFSENEYSETEIKETESEREFINPNLILSHQSIHDRGIDVMGKMEVYRDVIRENIAYKCFQDERYHRTDEVDELVELMVEVMLMPDDSVLRIAGVEKPAAVVKSRFMKLNQAHMEYIMTCLGANTRKVGNIRSYLLTVLYNATLTVNNYYTAEVNHDLH